MSTTNKSAEKTIQYKFHYLFQNQYNYDHILKKYEIPDKNHIIDSRVLRLKVKKTALIELRTIIKKFDYNSIITAPEKPIEDYSSLGMLSIRDIGNKKNMYFKHYTPYNTLFHNIFAQIYPNLLKIEDYDNIIFIENLEKLKGYIKYEKPIEMDNDILIKLITEPIKYNNIKSDMKNILHASYILSKFIETLGIKTNVVFIQDNLPFPSNFLKNQKNPSDVNIICLYIYHNESDKLIQFNPIISMNIDKGVIKYMIDFNSENLLEIQYIQSKLSYKLDEPITQVSHKKKIETVIPVLKDDFVTFNPNDKNMSLPIIEIFTDKGSQKYLLGNEYNGFYNIYNDDNKLNKLSGKVKFDGEGSKKILTVYWCATNIPVQ